MIDPKQKAKDEFKKIVDSDMDVMFAQTLSEDEVNRVVMQEVGTILEEVTTLNNINSDSIEEASAVVGQVKKVERDISDLNRIVEIKEELNKAA
jgi:hypothetical protein